MSAEGIASMFLGNKGQSELKLILEQLNTNIEIQTEKIEKPFIFLRSNRNNLSSNVADDASILVGPKTPQGFQGIIEDFNINFSTVAGTIKLVIMDANEQILNNLILDITASQSGIGRTVLENGQRLAVVGQTAGAGIFGVYCAGFLRRID